MVVIVDTIANPSHGRPNIGIKFDKPDGTATFWHTVFLSGRAIKTMSSFVQKLYSGVGQPPYAFKSRLDVEEGNEAILELVNMEIEVQLTHQVGRDGKVRPEIAEIFPKTSSKSNESLPWDDELPTSMRLDDKTVGSVFRQCQILMGYAVSFTREAMWISIEDTNHASKDRLVAAAERLEDKSKQIKKLLGVS
jgi:hypothetical protein